MGVSEVLYFASDALWFEDLEDVAESFLPDGQQVLLD